jgi:hypothetical protein
VVDFGEKKIVQVVDLSGKQRITRHVSLWEKTNEIIEPLLRPATASGWISAQIYLIPASHTSSDDLYYRSHQQHRQQQVASRHT